MSLSCFQAASSKRKEMTLQSNFYKAVPNIGNLDLGFSNVRNLYLGFSKHWNSSI